MASTAIHHHVERVPTATRLGLDNTSVVSIVIMQELPERPLAGEHDGPPSPSELHSHQRHGLADSASFDQAGNTPKRSQLE